MKRFFSLLLAALMLIGCASALAETTTYKQLGFAIDLSAVQDQLVNYVFLQNWGVNRRDPFLSSAGVYYVNLPKTVLESIESMEEDSEDAEAYEELKQALNFGIGEIVVTNAKNLVEAGADEAQLAQAEVIEFGTQGDYHYYLIYSPEYVPTRLSLLYDGAEDTGDYEHSPQEMKATALADIELVRSELLKQLQAAELFDPVDTDAEFIGQAVEFESVDLDGNVVKSADLFKDNKITMINIWGTWCPNCTGEMGELAELHKRLQEKGCGIVGVEYEREPMEDIADTARQVLADNGVTYPNVLIPEGNPVFERVQNYPFSLFVDSEGKILTYPIKGKPRDGGAYYESIFENLLSGEAIVESPQTGSTKNESGEYRVYVYDTEGNPVKGVVLQLCDESTCSFQKTKADGMATFQVGAPKVYDIHVGKVPEGYQSSDETYKTLDTYSDMDIFISKAE